MEKILVVFTGGTIGSRKAENDVINVDEAIGYSLIEALYNTSKANIAFDTIQPINILSENILPAHWEALNNAIAEQDPEKYIGIIMTHGTDTLPYTTAVFSYLFNNIALPVVFVSSNQCIGHPNSNGVENFTAAVQFIMGAKLPGVFSVHKNSSNRMIVYLGTRLLEADRLEDQYSSFKNIDFGEMKNGCFIYNSQRGNPPLDEFVKVNQSFKVKKVSIKNKVACIRPYPGLDYAMFPLNEARPSAILHLLYHSSTACIEPKENSLVEFARMCRKQGIDLYLLDCRHYADSGIYLTGKEIMQTGIFPLTDISYEAALAKLFVAYNQSALPPRAYMQKNIYHEYMKY